MKDKSEKKDFSVTINIEAITASGQFVNITCRYEDKEMVKQWIQKNIKEIEMPEIQEISEIGHGGYGFLSRYDIKQHRYAGGGFPGCGGYIEVLHVQNPPEKRHGIIIHVNKNGASTFYEIESLLIALDLFNEKMGELFDGEIPANSGIIRKVVCGWFQPWFYAIANQSLCGDYVFPDNIGIHDPIFSYPNKFIVKGYNGIKEVKTCIAFTKTQEKSVCDDREITQFTAWWTDGTYTCWGGSDSYRKPELLEAKDMWIQESVDVFRQLLSGEISEFNINTSKGKIISVKTEPRRNKSYRKIKIGRRQKPDQAHSVKIEIINEETWSGVFYSLLDEIY